MPFAVGAAQSRQALPALEEAPSGTWANWSKEQGSGGAPGEQARRRASLKDRVKASARLPETHLLHSG